MCEAAGPRAPALGAGGEAETGLRRRSYTVAIYTPPSMEVRWEQKFLNNRDLLKSRSRFFVP